MTSHTTDLLKAKLGVLEGLQHHDVTSAEAAEVVARVASAVSRGTISDARNYGSVAAFNFIVDRKRRHRGGVAQPGAVVDVVALHYQSGEFLLDIAILVGCFGRGQSAESVAAIFDQVASDILHRLFPTHRHQFSVFANQRGLDPVFMVHERETEPAFDAQHPDA